MALPPRRPVPRRSARPSPGYPSLSRAALAAAALAAGVAGCIPGDVPDSHWWVDSGDTEAPDTTPASDAPVGVLRVDELQIDDGSQDAYAQAWAWGILDRPFPDGFYAEYSTGYTGQLWAPMVVEGTCMMVAPTQGGSCDPACSEDEICGLDDQCQPRPQWAPAGDIDISGLTVPAMISPVGTGAYQTSILPAGSLEAGATVTAVAAGDQTPAFTLEATAPTPLEPALPCDQSIDETFSLGWTPGDGDAVVRLQVDSALHAANGPALICETEDDGSLEIPTAVLEAYLPYHGALSLWQLMRLERSEVELEDGRRIQLELRSVRGCFGG